MRPRVIIGSLEIVLILAGSFFSYRTVRSFLKFMVELDLWSDANVIRPLFEAAERSASTEESEEIVTQVLKAIPYGLEFDGLRPHQVRLEGGDASSDSYCFS